METGPPAGHHASGRVQPAHLQMRGPVTGLKPQSQRANKLAAAAATIEQAGTIAEVTGSAASLWLAPYVIAATGGQSVAIDRAGTHAGKQPAPATLCAPRCAASRGGVAAHWAVG
jgi:hypothetical protein